MKRIRTPRIHTAEAVYQVMLIIATVALALGVFFPTYEYFELYKGDPRPNKSSTDTRSIPGPVPRLSAMLQGTVPASAPAAAPAPAEAPTPVEEAAPAPQEGAQLPQGQKRTVAAQFPRVRATAGSNGK